MPRKEDGKLDVKLIVEHCEKLHIRGNIQYLFFPCNGRPSEKKLLISFGAWGGGYNRLRGYYEELSATHDMLFFRTIMVRKGRGSGILPKMPTFPSRRHISS